MQGIDQIEWRTTIDDFITTYIEVVVQDMPARQNYLLEDLFPRFVAIFSDNPYFRIAGSITHMKNIQDSGEPMLDRTEQREEYKGIARLVFSGAALASDIERSERNMRALEVQWFRTGGSCDKFKPVDETRQKVLYLFSRLVDSDFNGILLSFSLENEKLREVSEYLMDIICFYSLASRTDIILILMLTEVPLFKYVCGGARTSGPCRDFGHFKKWILAGDWSSKREAAVELIRQILRRLKGPDVLNERMDNLFKVLTLLDDIVVFFEEEVFEEGFYRDHLNHLVRVFLVGTLLCSHLFGAESTQPESSLVDSVAIASVLHDVARPTINQMKIQRHLRSVLSKGYSFLDPKSTSKVVKAVSILGSILPRSRLHEMDALGDWKGLASDKSIDEWWQAEVLGSEGSFDDTGNRPSLGSTGYEFPDDEKSLIVNLSRRHGILAAIEYSLNQKTRFENSTDRLVVQAMALHDGPEGGEFVIRFSEFPVAAITILADELQEWGRTVGHFEECAIEEMELELDSSGANATVMRTAFPLGEFDAERNGLEGILAFLHKKMSSLRRIEFDGHLAIEISFEFADVADQFVKITKLNSIREKVDGGREVSKSDFDFLYLDKSNELLAVPADLIARFPRKVEAKSFIDNANRLKRIAVLLNDGDCKRAFNLVRLNPEDYRANYETCAPDSEGAGAIDWTKERPTVFVLREDQNEDETSD